MKVITLIYSLAFFTLFSSANAAKCSTPSPTGNPQNCGGVVCPAAFPICSLEQGFYYCIADSCAAFGESLCAPPSCCVNNREGYSCVLPATPKPTGTPRPTPRPPTSKPTPKPKPTRHPTHKPTTPPTTRPTPTPRPSTPSPTPTPRPRDECNGTLCPAAFPICSFEQGYYYCIKDACAEYGNNLCIPPSQCVNNREGFSCVSPTNTPPTTPSPSPTPRPREECNGTLCPAAFPICSLEQGYYYCIKDACTEYGNDLCIPPSQCVNNREGFSCVPPPTDAPPVTPSPSPTPRPPQECNGTYCSPAFPICSFEDGYYYCIKDACADYGNDLCIPPSQCVNNREGFSCVSPPTDASPVTPSPSPTPRPQEYCDGELCPAAFPICSFEDGFYYCIKDACAEYGNDLCIPPSQCVNNREGFSCVSPPTEAPPTNPSPSPTPRPQEECNGTLCPAAFPICSLEEGYYYCIADACAAYGNDLCIPPSQCVNNREGFSCVSPPTDSPPTNPSPSPTPRPQDYCDGHLCPAAYPICSLEQGFYYCIKDACAEYGNDLCIPPSQCVNNREGFSCVSPPTEAPPTNPSPSPTPRPPEECNGTYCSPAYPICSLEEGYYYCIKDACAEYGNELCIPPSQCVNNREGFSCVSPPTDAPPVTPSPSPTPRPQEYCDGELCPAAYPICSFEQGYYYCIKDACTEYGNDLCIPPSQCVNNREGFSCI